METQRIGFENVPVLLRVDGPADAPLVLFAHAFPLHSEMWAAQLAAAAGAGFRAAAVDAPGFGGSPPLGRALRMDDLAQIFALALDHLHAPRAVLAGCSMGGYAVMAFARLFAERLAAAALVCTKGAADTAEAREKRAAQAQTALQKGASAVTDAALPNLVDAANEAALQRAKELAQAASAQGIADALRGMAERPDSTPSLKAWAAPALVLAGERDKLMTAQDTDALAAAIPRARKIVITNSGHLAPLEQPEQVSAAVVRLLQACRAANAWSRRASERSDVQVPA